MLASIASLEPPCRHLMTLCRHLTLLHIVFQSSFTACFFVASRCSLSPPRRLVMIIRHPLTIIYCLLPFLRLLFNATLSPFKPLHLIAICRLRLFLISEIVL